MRILSKKNVNYLRALKERIDTDKRKERFNKSQGYKKEQ
jgi:hypothetical protein